MITGDEYRARISKLKPNVFMGGEVIDRFDARIIGGINVMAKSYDFAFDPQFKEIGIVTSQFTGALPLI